MANQPNTILPTRRAMMSAAIASPVVAIGLTQPLATSAASADALAWLHDWRAAGGVLERREDGAGVEWSRSFVDGDQAALDSLFARWPAIQDQAVALVRAGA